MDRRLLGRGIGAGSPTPDELEPLTRAYWEVGRGVTAADYLLAVEDLQTFARVVAGFLGGWSTAASTCG